MTTDPVRSELTLPDDPRLIPAVGAVVVHAAERAGLAQRVREGFAAASIEACRERFSLIHKAGEAKIDLRVSVVDYPDRIEVSIENAGGAAPSGDTQTLQSAQQHAMVDRVLQETHNGRVRTTLIKYIGAHAPGPEE